MVPCRMPIWLAGVVAGSLGRHSAIRCDPLRIHRDSVGRVPARTPQSSTGNGTPSAWTNTMPGTSGSSSAGGRLRRAPRSRLAVTASSVPAVATQTNSVETAATTQDARNVAHTGASSSVGVAARTTQMTSVWPNRPISIAPTQPRGAAMTTSTGRRIAADHEDQDGDEQCPPEVTDVEVGNDPRRDDQPEVAPTRPTTARPRSPHRSFQRRAGRPVLVMAGACRPAPSPCSPDLGEWTRACTPRTYGHRP